MNGFANTLRLRRFTRTTFTLILLTFSAFTFAQDAYREVVFHYTGNAEIFTVPQGVSTLLVEVAGASGGHAWRKGATNGHPGLGGVVEAALKVSPGQQLYLYVGGEGATANAGQPGNGGFNGGADGGIRKGEYASGGGGGASDIRLQKDALDKRIVVAGGGGAAGQLGTGGNGGGLLAGSAEGDGQPALGGGQQKGGLSGISRGAWFAQNGTFGVGGGSSAGNNGGGGGGGWYGGGGGALGDGGGGSSFTGTDAENVLHKQGANKGNGYIIIRYRIPENVQSIVSTEAVKPRMVVYPNPSSGDFYMQLNNTQTGQAEMVLQRESGAVFLRKSFWLKNSNALLHYIMPGKVAGFYFVTITTDEGKFTGKVVVR